MRALFICRTERTKLMAHIAEALQAHGELERADAFVAYYDEWRHYLRNDSKVQFQEVYGTREIFQRMGSEPIDLEELMRIEREYGADEIWNAIFCERYLTSLEHYNVYNHPKYSEEDVLRYVQLCFQVAERIFDQARPNCIIDFASVGIFRGVLDRVANRRGVLYLHPFAQLADRFSLYTRVNEDYSFINRTYNQLLTQEAPCEEGWRYLNLFRETNQQSIYKFHQIQNDSTSSNTSKGLGRVLREKARVALKPLIFAKSVIGEIRLRLFAAGNPMLRYNFQLYKNLPSIKLYRSLLHWSRKAMLSLHSPFYNSPMPNNYAFMTLHLQPEASTSVMAPFFANQRYVIENTVRALPFHWKLVIKPHPFMIGKEPVGFYRHLKKIPNVHLVPPTANTRQLIMGSQAVVTITGTSGFEALLLGKKVIVLGNPFFGICHSVSKCTDFTQLHSLFRNAEDYKPDDNDLAAFLQAVHDHSFSLKKNYIWEGPYDMSDPGYKEAIDIIAQQIAKTYREYQK